MRETGLTSEETLVYPPYVMLSFPSSDPAAIYSVGTESCLQEPHNLKGNRHLNSLVGANTESHVRRHLSLPRMQTTSTHTCFL